MPYHKHVPPGDRRLAWEEVTLHAVMEEFWPMIQDRDEENRARLGEENQEDGDRA
jgi:hypothetical protein